MTSTATEMAAEAASERLAGGRPSRRKAFTVALVSGVAAAAAVYKLLRSEPDDRGSEG